MRPLKWTGFQAYSIRSLNYHQHHLGLGMDYSFACNGLRLSML